MKIHQYREQGLVARPVWLLPVEAKRVRDAARRRGVTAQEFMRKALLSAAGRTRS